MLLDRYYDHRAEREIDTELYRRIATVTLSEVKGLIAAGAMPDVPVRNDINDDFYTIHRAALNPDIEVLKYIVSLGVDPCRYDFWARQPLSFAVRKNPLEFAQYLVGLGNKANHEDDDGEPVLSEAALNPHTEVLDFLIENGADVNTGGMGDMPLEQAVKHGTSERVKYFIDHGALVKYADDLTLFAAPLENIRLLLENGYDPNKMDDFNEAKVIDHLDPERQALLVEFGGKILNPDAEKHYLTYPEAMLNCTRKEDGR